MEMEIRQYFAKMDEKNVSEMTHFVSSDTQNLKGDMQRFFYQID